jgi:alpha-ketoglutarate-dependent taurine dioxygenase
VPLVIRPLHPHIGAEITGIDLADETAPAVWEQIQAAFHQHLLLVFRDQRIDEAATVRFARRFGPLEEFVDASYRGARYPEITRLTNLDENGRPYGPCAKMAKMSLAENWHTDSSYRAIPALATLLHGMEVPGVGGDTGFASMYRAYEQLSDEQRRRIDKLSVIHSWEYQRGLVQGFPPLSDDERQAAPPVRHPLVRQHPQTLRNSVYISSSAIQIEGLPPNDGVALLRELIEIATAPENVYIHRWRPLDLLIWDNRVALHRSEGFDYQSLEHRRLLHRIVVAGSPTAPLPAPTEARA